VVDEDDVRLNTSDVCPIQCGCVIDEFGIGELPDECRNLGPHTMLHCQSLMRELFQYEALKERPIKVVPFAFLDTQLIIVDFRTKLSEHKRECHDMMHRAKRIHTYGHR
jgi:hypothetical protein